MGCFGFTVRVHDGSPGYYGGTTYASPGYGHVPPPHGPPPAYYPPPPPHGPPPHYYAPPPHGPPPHYAHHPHGHFI